MTYISWPSYSDTGWKIKTTISYDNFQIYKVHGQFEKSFGSHALGLANNKSQKL